MPRIEWVELNEFQHATGILMAAEGADSIPFEIKRVYCLYDLDPTARRGFHAHRELEQVLFCLHGSCRVLLDDGFEKVEALIDRRNRGLMISRMTWREMFDFSDGCVIMVIASMHYDEADYIRDYDEFLQILAD